jgi:hypothetical protein
MESGFPARMAGQIAPMCPVRLRQIGGAPTFVQMAIRYDAEFPSYSRLRHFGYAPAFKECEVESNLRISEVLQNDNHTHGNLERAPGTVVSFVPAHGDSKAGVVAKQLSRTLTEGLGGAVLLANFDSRGYSLWDASQSPRRLDGHTWGAFVHEDDGLETLDARETNPRQLTRLFDHAREKYKVICADMTGSRPAHALEVLRASDAIFLVTDSDHASMEGVLEKIEWLRSINLMDRVGLLLRRSPDGLGADQVEDLTGAPVCSLIETEGQLKTLAQWLASNTAVGEESGFAMAG